MAEAPQLKSDQFEFAISETAGLVTVAVTGTISIPDPKPLSQFMDKVHAYAAAGKVRRLNVDIRQLEFINSTGFKPLIYWLSKILSMPPEQRYTLNFLLLRSKRWQETVLSALSCFAPTNVTIDRRD